MQRGGELDAVLQSSSQDVAPVRNLLADRASLTPEHGANRANIASTLRDIATAAAPPCTGWRTTWNGTLNGFSRGVGREWNAASDKHVSDPLPRGDLVRGAAG